MTPIRVRKSTAGIVLVASAALALACAKRSADQSATTESAKAGGTPAAPPEPAAAPPPSQPPAPTDDTYAPSPKSASAAQPQATSPELDRRERDEDQGVDAKETFADLSKAEAALDKAQKDLDALLGPAKTKDKTGKAAPGGGGAVPLATGDARCPTACKAFASLRRAATAVCRLAGDADARCTKARTSVTENEARVAACKCERTR